MWHYQYTIERMLHHFDAESFEACVGALLKAITRSPQLTGIKIFESGKHLDAFGREAREIFAQLSIHSEESGAGIGSH